jgi:type II secretion system protein H
MLRGCIATIRGSRRAGFTLVEVLMVVAVLGIVSAVVVPSVLSSHRLVAQAATRSIVANLSNAQNEAIARQQPVGVVFEVAQNRYKLIDGQGNVLTPRHTPGGTSVAVVDFDEASKYQGVELVSATLGSDSGAPRVIYDALGSPDTGGTITLKANDHRFKVDVADFTGRITVDRMTSGS